MRLGGRTLVQMAIAGSALWFGLAGAQTALAAQTAGTPGANPAIASRIAQSSGEALTLGCNVVTLSNLTVGMKVSDWVAQNVQPASAVISVWHYDNASQHYQANYFNDPAVPVDQPTFKTAVDAFFICVSGNATAP